MLSIVCSLVSQEHIKQFELWPNFNVDILILEANLTIYITELWWLYTCVSWLKFLLLWNRFFSLENNFLKFSVYPNPSSPKTPHPLKKHSRASLVAQWLSVCLPMQGTRVWALVWEDPTCRGAAGPVSHNYWASASGACAPQQERPR